MRNGLALALLCFLAAAACGRAPPGESGLDDSTYVEVMARLTFIRQRAEASLSAETARWADSARLAVLADYGVDPEALERYAARHGSDPAHMERVWDRMAAVLDSIALRAARAEGPIELGRDATASAPDSVPADSARVDSVPADSARVDSATAPDSAPAPSVTSSRDEGS